jgi:2-hydroxy-3-keto-5-methylthiopentenyl-1-phosphate phosphatase
MAGEADYVIAKDALLGFCRARGLPHASFRTFDDVTAHLAEWLAGLERGPRRPLARVHEERWGRRT